LELAEAGADFPDYWTQEVRLSGARVFFAAQSFSETVFKPI
jgi:hypothetical protein